MGTKLKQTTVPAGVDLFRANRTTCPSPSNRDRDLDRLVGREQVMEGER